MKAKIRKWVCAVFSSSLFLLFVIVCLSVWFPGEFRSEFVPMFSDFFGLDFSVVPISHLALFVSMSFVSAVSLAYDLVNLFDFLLKALKEHFHQ